MNQQRPGMFMPALVGGVVAGLLTAVPFLGCFCCLWIIGGAMLAAYLLAKNSPTSVTPGDGAIVGIFAGIVGAVVDAIVSIPFEAMNREAAQKVMDMFSQYLNEMPSAWKSLLDRAGERPSPAFFMLGLVISAAVFAALGALGGVIGAALFGRKKTSLPPGPGNEPPQNSGYRQS
jgi:hypothetical protein